MSRKVASYYDEEDYGDDDFYADNDDYDEYDEPVAEAKPKKVAVGGAASAKAAAKSPAQAAGASTLACCLCDPPPGRPMGRTRQGKRLAPAGGYPVAPAVPPAEGVAAFAFDTPSPDDRVLAARRGGGAQQPRSSNAALPATAGMQALRVSDPPAARAKPAAAPAAQGAGDRGAEAAGLRPGSGPGSLAGPGADAAAPAPQRSRPAAEYALEPDLARECAAAGAAEAAGERGTKPQLHLVVLGHVDAGKSTLMGRLLHDLGQVSQKAAHRHARDAAAAGKASFGWAWLLDERAEERARGVTVDVATARFETPRRAVVLLDAPGHRDFVPNMIAGAAQADAALLLVDGSPGGFEAGFDGAGNGHAGSGGQTREHAQLARSLGVEQLAVVVSKLDTCGYSQERFEAIRGALAPFLRTCGFRDSQVQWLPAVGPAGENLVRAPEEPRLAAWWRGPCVLGAIDAFAPPARNVARPLRLPVAEVGKGARGGTAVSGKLEAGALRVGTRVLVMPGSHAASVHAVEVNGAPAALARAGDAVEVSLAGVDAAAVAPGAVVCHPEWPLQMAARVEARVVVLDVAIPILRGQQVTLHAHAAREAGAVTALVALLHARTGEVARKRPRALLRGQTAVIEVTPARSMCLEPYSECRALGRLALRDGGRTLAVGIVTAVLA